MAASAGSSGEPDTRPTRPWVTSILLIVCVALFALNRQTAVASPRWLGEWGYFPAVRGWDSLVVALWAGLTNALHHQSPIHLLFNLGWLWFFGWVLEPEIGTVKFALLAVLGGMASSATQIAWEGASGIGASGIVYALFGAAWTLRGRSAPIRRALDQRVLIASMTWLFACAVILPHKIGNGAHFGGFLFGLAFGWLVLRGPSSGLRWAAVVGFGVLLSLPSFLCPWQPEWVEWGIRSSEDDPKLAEEASVFLTEGWPQRPYGWEQLVRLRLAKGDTQGARDALARLEALHAPEAAALAVDVQRASAHAPRASPPSASGPH